MSEVIITSGNSTINVNITGAGPRGLSAYEAWLSLGNTGTKQDFINSQFDEPARVSNENTRKNAEIIRVQNENIRIENENDREDNEDVRIAAENIRVTNENTRISKENARNVYEDYDNTHDYVIGNKVYYNGSSYLCTSPCKGVLPTVLDNWLLISAGGNTPAASAVPIQDAAGHFTATNVEQALKETKEQINTLDAQKADKAEVTLKADKTALDTINAKVASNYSTLDTKINSQASGSPKGTYATLVDLQTAFPMGNTNIYIVTADGNWYYWNGSAWTIGGVYQSTGIADGSILPKYTNFMHQSKNLVAPSEITYGKFMNASGASYESTDYAYTGFIAVTEGDIIKKQCFRIGVGLNYTMQYLTAYDENKVVVPESGSNKAITSYAVPNGVAYVIITYQFQWSGVAVTNLMVEKTTEGVATEYVPYAFYLNNENIEPKSIDDEMLSSKFIKTIHGVSPDENGNSIIPDNSISFSTLDEDLKSSNRFVDYLLESNGYTDIGTLPLTISAIDDLDIVKVDLVDALGDTTLIFDTANDINMNGIVITPASKAILIKQTESGFVAKRKDKLATSGTLYLYQVSFNATVESATQYSFNIRYKTVDNTLIAPAVFIVENGTAITTTSTVQSDYVNVKFTTGADITTIEIRVRLGTNLSYLDYDGEIEFYETMLYKGWTKIDYIVYNPQFTILSGNKAIIPVTKPSTLISTNTSYNGIAKVYAPLINSVDEAYIPSYVDVETKATIDKLYSIQNGNTASIAFITDLHNSPTYPVAQNRDAVTHSIISLGKIADSVSIDFLCLGGDYVLNNTTSTLKNECFEHIKDLRDKVSKYTDKINKFWLRGNHDGNPVDFDVNQRIKTEEIFIRTLKPDLKTATINKDDKGDMYGFVDLPLQKIRLVFLNMYTHLTYDQLEVNTHGLSPAEIKWVLGNALNFSDKADKSEWGILLFSHLPMYADFTNKSDFINGLVAFKNGIDYTYDSIAYPFTAQGAIEVVACIAGDVHYDKSTTVNGILSITTQNASLNSTIYGTLPADGTIYEKVAFTAEETSYDIFTVDRTKGKLYATRYGAGVDRVWDI